MQQQVLSLLCVRHGPSLKPIQAPSIPSASLLLSQLQGVANARFSLVWAVGFETCPAARRNVHVDVKLEL